MTLKLVHDSNVETLPVGNLMDIGGMARRFAEEIDSGIRGEVTRVTLIIETGEALQRETWGEIPNGYELIGLLEYVKAATIADDAIED